MACNATMCLPPDYVDMLFDFKKKTKESEFHSKTMLQYTSE